MKFACADHGTYRAGCFDCAEQARAYNSKWRKHRAAYGRMRVPADEARAHIRRLKDAGFAGSAIARATGLAPSFITNLANGKVTEIHRDREALILGVTVAKVKAATLMVPADASMLKLRHLQLRGHSGRAIGDAIGTNPGNILEIISGERSMINRRIVDLIDAYYEANWRVDGGSQLAKNRARRARWRPYLGEAA